MKFVFIFILTSCFTVKIKSQIYDKSTSKFSWEKTRKLSYSDYKLRYAEDTNGYLAAYILPSGEWRDTVVPSFFIDTGFLYHGVSDSIAHSEVVLNPYYEIKKNTIKYNIYVEFYPYKSYMRVRTPDILMHEQIHFNMVELFARKVRKYINNCTINNIDSIPIIIAYYNDEQMNKQNSFDMDAWADFYDNVGNLYHSDSLWKRIVDKQLDSFRKYEKAQGTVIIK